MGNMYEPKSKRFPAHMVSFADCSSPVKLIDFSRYVAPIQVFESPMDIMVQNEVCTAVKRVGVHVEKDELLRALEYDRNQYAAGFRAGVESAQPEWISVEEVPPKNNEVYLACGARGGIRVARYHVGDGWAYWKVVDSSRPFKAVYYMPLPEPPEEG